MKENAAAGDLNDLVEWKCVHSFHYVDKPFFLNEGKKFCRLMQVRKRFVELVGNQATEVMLLLTK